MSVAFRPAGDLALLIEFEEEISVRVNSRVRMLEALIREARIAGVVETVPAFRSLLVHYDPLRVDEETLRASISSLLPQTGSAKPPASRRVEIPCCYDDPELGFELAAAARSLGMSASGLAELHSSDAHLVYFLGFAPGQPYLTGTARQIAIPRLETPRTTTPAGSVGIGGIQSCIYAVASPGGFWVLGRTPLAIYDPAAPDPVLLRPGDIVTFRRIERAEYERIGAAVAARTYRPAIT
ncbi:MAG: 5-oxoprolinase subunit PxpB [Burkholderiales bacterium]|nr:5-oxoprolinase subunit PxpB [Burkholderiales bacterium]